MADAPSLYFYLVDVETDQPIARFSVDGCETYAQLHALEARIRTRHNVDDPASGLALRDTAHHPLPAAVLRKLPTGSLGD